MTGVYKRGDERHNRGMSKHPIVEAAQAVRTLAATAAVALLLLCCALGTVQANAVVDASPAPKTDPLASAAPLVERHEAAGLECSEEPSLTDTIVVVDAGSASTLTFDEAYAAAEAGATVAAYCA